MSVQTVSVSSSPFKLCSPEFIDSNVATFTLQCSDGSTPDAKGVCANGTNANTAISKCIENTNPEVSGFQIIDINNIKLSSYEDDIIAVANLAPITEVVTAVTRPVDVTNPAYPTNLQTELDSGCTGTCKYVAADFTNATTSSADVSEHTSMPYIVKTDGLAPVDAGVFMSSDAPEPIVLNGPLGYDFEGFAFTGTAQASSSNNLVKCATWCDNVTLCEGFNFSPIDNSCTLLSNFHIADDGTNSGNTQIGFSKRKVPITSLTQYPSYVNLSTNGKTCLDITECNRQLTIMINAGKRNFSTSDIPACSGCPERSVYNNDVVVTVAGPILTRGLGTATVPATVPVTWTMTTGSIHPYTQTGSLDTYLLYNFGISVNRVDGSILDAVNLCKDLCFSHYRCTNVDVTDLSCTIWDTLVGITPDPTYRPLHNFRANFQLQRPQSTLTQASPLTLDILLYQNNGPGPTHLTIQDGHFYNLTILRNSFSIKVLMELTDINTFKMVSCVYSTPANQHKTGGTTAYPGIGSFSYVILSSESSKTSIIPTCNDIVTLWPDLPQCLDADPDLFTFTPCEYIINGFNITCVNKPDVVSPNDIFIITEITRADFFADFSKHATNPEQTSVYDSDHTRYNTNTYPYNPFIFRVQSVYFTINPGAFGKPGVFGDIYVIGSKTNVDSFQSIYTGGTYLWSLFYDGVMQPYIKCLPSIAKALGVLIKYSCPNGGTVSDFKCTKPLSTGCACPPGKTKFQKNSIDICCPTGSTYNSTTDKCEAGACSTTLFTGAGVANSISTCLTGMTGTDPVVIGVVRGGTTTTYTSQYGDYTTACSCPAGWTQDDLTCTQDATASVCTEPRYRTTDYVTAVCTPTSDTVIATRSCSSGQYASGFSQGSATSVGVAGTCTGCSQPTTGTAQYVSTACSTPQNTTISTKTCSSGQYASGFSQGSATSAGNGGTCTGCSQPTTGTAQYVTGVCTVTQNTIIATRSCSSGQYASGFSQGSATSVGVAGTCTGCSNPGSGQYTSRICTVIQNTGFTTATTTSCSPAYYLSTPYVSGSWSQLGQDGVCSTCPIGSYCPGGGSRLPCRAGMSSATSSTTKKNCYNCSTNQTSAQGGACVSCGTWYGSQTFSTTGDDRCISTYNYYNHYIDYGCVISNGDLPAGAANTWLIRLYLLNNDYYAQSQNWVYGYVTHRLTIIENTNVPYANWKGKTIYLGTSNNQGVCGMRIPGFGGMDVFMINGQANGPYFEIIYGDGTNNLYGRFINMAGQAIVPPNEYFSTTSSRRNTSSSGFIYFTVDSIRAVRRQTYPSIEAGSAFSGEWTPSAAGFSQTFTNGWLLEP